MTQTPKSIDVVAAIIERDGHILLARRPPHADQPGLWEFAGGKVEAGETQPQALVRELREELGIEAVPACFVASHQREVSERLITLHAWHVCTFAGEPTRHYHSELAWVTPANAGNYALAPADLPLLEAFKVLRDATPAD